MAELTKAQRRSFLQDLHTLCRRHGVSSKQLKDAVSEGELPAPPPPKFRTGDRVAWNHKLAGFHGHGSVVLVDSLPTDSFAAPDGEEGADAVLRETPIGTVVGPANEQNTWWIVSFDDEHLDHPGVVGAAGTHEDDDKLVLTGDELVKVQED